VKEKASPDEASELKNDELMSIPIHIHSSIQRARDLVKLAVPREIRATGTRARNPRLSRRRAHCSRSILPLRSVSPSGLAETRSTCFTKVFITLRGFSCRVANITEMYRSCCFAAWIARFSASRDSSKRSVMCSIVRAKRILANFVR